MENGKNFAEAVPVLTDAKLLLLLMQNCFTEKVINQMMETVTWKVLNTIYASFYEDNDIASDKVM